MADNADLNAGSGGITLALDEIAGVHHQRVKVQHGADGSATDVSSASPMPVTSASLPLPAGAATVAAQLPDGHAVTVDNASLAITAAALPLPSGAATEAAQLPDGHAVTVDNASIVVTNGGTFAVQDDNSANAIDAGNSTTTPLGISAVFTGTGVDVSGYSAVAVTLFADEDSAVGGMTFQFSTDDTNWDDVSSFNMTADDTRRFQFPVTAQYFRVVYTNGTTGQGAFRVQTVLHRRNILTSIHRVDDDTDPDRSAQIVKAVLIAQAAGSGDYLNINSTNGGNLKVAVEEFDASLPAGTNNIGDVDVASIAAGDNNIGNVDVASIAAGANLIGDVGVGVRTSGGTTLYKNIDVDESEDQVKGTAGQLYWIHAMNLSATKKYLKIYNATAASVVVGTTVPDLTFPIPTQGDANGAGFVLAIPNGIAFSTAITIAATTGIADNDSGAPGANEVVVNLGYA